MTILNISNIVINLALFVLILWSLTKHRYDHTFFYLVVSTTMGMFGLQFFGPNIQFSHVIGLMMFNRTYRYVKKSALIRQHLRYFIWEYLLLIVLGIYFGFIDPWYDPRFPRPFSQSAPGRTVITLVREFCEIGVICFVAYVFNKRYVTKELFFKFILLCLVTNTAVAVITYFTPLNVRSILLGARELPGRFCGIDAEPKHYGKTNAISFATFLVFYITKALPPAYNGKLLFGMILAVMNIILSGSTSSIIILSILIFAVVTMIRWNPIEVFRSKYSFLLIGLSVAFVVGLQIFQNTHYYDDVFRRKIDQVTGTDPEKPAFRGEPKLFRQWELWDRYAADFLYLHPQYLLLGTGPNLIHIPMTQYATKLHLSTYKGGLNSVPKMGWMNYLSRSGIVGLFLFFCFFLKMIRSGARYHNLEAFLLAIVLLIYIVLTLSAWHYLLSGYIIHLLWQSRLERLQIRNTKRKYHETDSIYRAGICDQTFPPLA